MIKKLPVTGMFTTNSYFLIDSETNHGFLIDPAAEAGKLLNYINVNNLIIEKILITHGHFDHIGAVKEISEALNIPVYVHEKAAFVGDNIFYGGMGRSDFYGGDSVTLLTEVKNKILTMPEDTVLYPGHGKETTVRREKNTNPYFNMSSK